MASLMQLVAYGSDSDAGSHSDEDVSPSAANVEAPIVNKGVLVEEVDDEEEEDEGGDEEESFGQDEELVNDVATPPVSDDESDEGDWPFKVKVKFAARLIPPPPGSHCSNTLQRKIEQLIQKRDQQGINLNESVQRRKDFRNPSIYEKLVSFLGLDEQGTCFPETMYNGSSWSEDHCYEALAKIQREAHEKKKSSRTQVEFVKGTKRPAPAASSSAGEGGDKKRRSKWDSAAPVQAAAPLPLPTVPVVTLQPGPVANPLQAAKEAAKNIGAVHTRLLG